MKFIIYAIGLAIVTLIMKSLRALKRKGFEKTSSILKFNFLLIIPAVLAATFVMSQFYTSPYSTRFEKSHGNTDTETLISDRVSGNHFTISEEYSVVEFGKHLDVVTSGLGDNIQVYTPGGTQKTGILPFLFRNPFLSFWIVFIIIEGLGNWLWIRRVTKRGIRPSDIISGK